VTVIREASELDWGDSGVGTPKAKERRKTVRAKHPTNIDYPKELRSVIETWLLDSGIAGFVDSKGIIDLMQRINALNASKET